MFRKKMPYWPWPCHFFKYIKEYEILGVLTEDKAEKLTHHMEKTNQACPFATNYILCSNFIYFILFYLF